MAMNLVVRTQFETYKIGDWIDDPETVDRIVASHPDFVIKVDGLPALAPDPAAADAEHT